MNTEGPAALGALLHYAEVVGIELGPQDQVARIHNASLLAIWLARGDGVPLPEGQQALLNELFGLHHAQQLREGLQRLGGSADQIELGVVPGRHPRAGASPRLFNVTLRALPDGGGCILLQDVSRREALLQELQEVSLAQEIALTVLRAPPDGLRLFLSSAMASVSAIRATLRMPARTADTLRQKLARLQAEASTLGAEARSLGLSPVARCCQVLADSAARLQAQGEISGDDLLPLAPRVDAIASTIGATARTDEQRFEPPAAEPARRQRPGASWHEVSERRWSGFLRRRGEDIGTLARLAMSGAELVPAFQRRHVDEILQHLLRNAVDHGIETPEQRLAAGKPAAGRITIGFSRGAQGRLKMTVHDDGRGFDLSRIGRAAVQSGLLTEESLARSEAGELVGLIFKPSFTTEGLDAGDGQGRGMSYLRRKVTRLGGQISVATKQGRYTLFTIELPESEISDDAAGISDQAIP